MGDEIGGPQQAGPPFDDAVHPLITLGKLALPSVDTAERELAMTLMGELFLLSPHCSWERWPHPSLQDRKNWSWWYGQRELVLLLPWGGAAPVTWSDHLNYYCPSPQPWPTALTSTLSRTCWSSWRDWTWYPRELQDPGWLQGIWEEFRWRSTDDAVWETRGLEPRQWLIAMNMWKTGWLHKRMHCVMHHGSRCH